MQWMLKVVEIFHLLASDVESEHTFGRSKTNVVCPTFGGR